jgi:L-asparaginase
VRSVAFQARLETRVGLVKAYPGCDGSLVDWVVEKGERGLVVEGLPGQGGLPPGMHGSVGRAVDQGLLVALASRAPHGRISSPPTGGTGEPLVDLGLLSAGDLTAEKAWILLMVVLAQAGAPDELAEQFSRTASHVEGGRG